MAATLKDVDGFTRPGIDGKKAQNRFLLLVRHHKSNNNEAARLSGATEDETPKSRLQELKLASTMEPEPATPRAPAPSTTYDLQQGSLSDRTLDDGFYNASAAAATPQPAGATEPMASLSRVQARSTVISQRSPIAQKRDSCRGGEIACRWSCPLCDQLPWSADDNDPTARTKGVSTECGCAPALQQHELQMTAHRERIAADGRQAHFEWEQRQIHEAAAQYKYAVKHDAAAHAAQFKANMEREASRHKVHLDTKQQRAFLQQCQPQLTAVQQQQQQLWQQQQHKA
ncbi:hypothetical protein H257_10425 [Aphanomyces astaci]|uniref:Uncharacterized protein n=1 Tax=Aphanomyces astaci TaxID=112090 RepID=W4G7H3_APHAT|nr:hypothetical protein H257_10425 [Aphanomyces astaci]ETV75231.1 hypothetical protein H257_10425 [Aphanomyces astaci]|eukprot:XP_009835279.1 hypothetical protein H257_10425 [Aphanomyces astaci]